MPTRHFADFDSLRWQGKHPPLLPPSYSEAIGDIVLAFSTLEVQLSVAIAYLLESDDESADIVVAELSFRNKVDLLGSLIQHHLPSKQFNAGNDRPEDVHRELIALCLKADGLRNQILHSAWNMDPKDNSIIRDKVTAKAGKGLQVQVEHVPVGDLHKICHFIWHVISCIADFFEHFEHPLINKDAV